MSKEKKGVKGREGARGRKVEREGGRERGEKKGDGKGILAIPILVCFQHRCFQIQIIASVATKLKINKMLSYRRETALQGTLVLAESGRLELGDNILLIL